jgi:type 1 fimbriae regulatory protein FimE
MRSREYLTPHEVEKLIAAAKLGRHGRRDATPVLAAFRHGLRASRLPTWSGRKSNVDAIRRCTSVGRRTASRQFGESRMLRELQRNATGSFVFATERRGGPFTADAA